MMDWDEYLREAWKSSDYEQVRYALEQGADANVDVYGDGNTILYWAVRAALIDLVRLLLASGAKVAWEDKADETSVHIAVQQNQKGLLEQLLDADGAVALDWFDYLDRTPLMCAVEDKNLEMAQMLLRAGAHVNAHNEKHIGNTALRLAAERGDSEMVKLLLDAGADPLIPGWMGLTPLDKAKRRRSDEGLKVRALIEQAAAKRGVR